MIAIIAANTWYYIVLVRVGDTTSLYLDTEKIGSERDS